MEPQANIVRKAICRYFASTGECFYGDDCQFVHQPNQRNHSVSSNFMSDALGKMNSKLNSNAASFNHPAMLPPESKLTSYLQSTGAVLGNSMSIVVPSSSQLHELQAGLGGMNLSAAGGGASSKRKIMGQPGMSNGISGLQINSPPFIPTEDIKVELLKKQGLILNFSNGEAFSEIPARVDKYHDLYPLDGAITTPSTTFNMITTIYKATNMKTGQLVCLRRLHSFSQLNGNVFPKTLQQQLDTWQQIEHANIVQLHDVFFTKEFGDNSLIFVYDYFPISKTLLSQYFLTSNHGLFNSGGSGSPTTTNRPYSQQQQAIRQKLLPEPLIWSYIIQISSALRTIHLNGLVCRSLDPSKIIITSGFAPEVNQFQTLPMHYPRVKLSSCGIFDVIHHDQYTRDLQLMDHKQLLQHLQLEDLIAFGKLCVILACNSVAAVKRENWSQSLEIISRHFSNDLRQLIIFLVSGKPSGSEASMNGSSSTKSINDIMPMIGARFYNQLDQAYQRSDQIEAELNRELDNSRLFRLLAKLGSINERPELKNDPNWSETGDRYMLKLFRDYLFHQNTDDGRPFLDLGHIVCTLNKLDVGSSEKILLMSRDQQNVLIVSFAELRKCFDTAFNELLCSG